MDMVARDIDAERKTLHDLARHLVSAGVWPSGSACSGTLDRTREWARASHLDPDTLVRVARWYSPHLDCDCAIVALCLDHARDEALETFRTIADQWIFAEMEADPGDLPAGPECLVGELAVWLGYGGLASSLDEFLRYLDSFAHHLRDATDPRLQRAAHLAREARVRVEDMVPCALDDGDVSDFYKPGDIRPQH